LPKELSLSSQKYELGIRDPRSGIRDPETKRHRIPDPDPQHWFEHWQVLNFDFDADPDPYPAFHSNEDLYPDLATQNKADLSGSESATLLFYI
jgi:hypothetical protein